VAARPARHLIDHITADAAQQDVGGLQRRVPAMLKKKGGS
jgi:hypothetical protein